MQERKGKGSKHKYCLVGDKGEIQYFYPCSELLSWQHSWQTNGDLMYRWEMSRYSNLDCCSPKYHAMSKRRGYSRRKKGDMKLNDLIMCEKHWRISRKKNLVSPKCGEGK
jgi:hypothetical protein